MKDLLEALQIFLKYGNPYAPLNCCHDLLYVDINPDKVSKEDKDKLEKLGFCDGEKEDLEGGFISYRFGSC